MMIRKSGSRAHKMVTRVLATTVMLGMYAFGMIATTGLAITAGTTPAYAQRGRGRGGGRGWGGGRGRGWGGPGVGAAIGLGVGAAVIGGAIAAQEAERAAAAQNAADYCMRRFRSYDPESGTYVGRDGLRRPCP